MKVPTLFPFLFLALCFACNKHAQSSSGSSSINLDLYQGKGMENFTLTASGSYGNHYPEIVFPDSNGRATLSSPSISTTASGSLPPDEAYISLSFNVPSTSIQPGKYTYDLPGVNTPQGPDSVAAYNGGIMNLAYHGSLATIVHELISDTVAITSVNGGLISGIFTATYYSTLRSDAPLRCTGQFKDFPVK
jgi:hypothetical protein